MEDKRENFRIWRLHENQFQVRDAGYPDLKMVYEMIIELAKDLKADISKDVKSSEAEFLNDFHNGYFHLIIAEKKNDNPIKEDMKDEDTKDGCKLNDNTTY